MFNTNDLSHWMDGPSSFTCHGSPPHLSPLIPHPLPTIPHPSTPILYRSPFLPLSPLSLLSPLTRLTNLNPSSPLAPSSDHLYYTLSQRKSIFSDITWNVVGLTWYYAEYFMQYHVFHYILCYIAEIWITCQFYSAVFYFLLKLHRYSRHCSTNLARWREKINVASCNWGPERVTQ